MCDIIGSYLLWARSRSDKTTIEFLRLDPHHICIPKLYFPPKLYYSDESRNGIPGHSMQFIAIIIEYYFPNFSFYIRFSYNEMISIKEMIFITGWFRWFNKNFTPLLQSYVADRGGENYIDHPVKLIIDYWLLKWI